MDYAAIFPDEGRFRHADEKAMLDYARDSVKLCVQRGGIGDLAEIAVEDVVPLIGDIRITICVLT